MVQRIDEKKKSQNKFPFSLFNDLGEVSEIKRNVARVVDSRPRRRHHVNTTKLSMGTEARSRASARATLKTR